MIAEYHGQSVVHALNGMSLAARRARDAMLRFAETYRQAQQRDWRVPVPFKRNARRYGR